MLLVFRLFVSLYAIIKSRVDAMMKSFLYILSFFVSLLLFSCSRVKVSDVLDKAWMYANMHNDSALIMLEQINPSGLPDEELASYYLIQAFINHHKGKVPEGDSILSFSENYYRTVSRERDLAEVLLLRGWNSNYQKNYVQANAYYKEALELWLTQNDSAKISQTYLEMSWVADKASPVDSVYPLLGKALNYSKGNSHINQLIYMGNLYAHEGNLNQAEKYYNEAYAEADSLNNRYLLLTIRDRFIHLYTESGMPKEAFRHLNAFLSMKKGRYQTAYSMLARANIWKSIHQYDSAFHYYTLASQSVNPHVATEAYIQLKELYVTKGKYDEAVNVMRTFESLWNNDERNLETVDAMKRYEEMKLKNELNEIKLAKKNRELYLLSLFVVIVLIAIIAYIVYSRNKKNKEEQWLKEQAQLLEKENRILKQAEELSALREKEAGLREALFRKMSVFHKIPSLESGGEQEKTDKRIVISEEDWADIVQIVDSSYNGFATRLMNEYPLLTKKDVRFCCLVKINVTLKDLSDIYCVSKSAITKKKFRIKVEKIGFMDGDKSLDDFLETF